MAVLAETVKTVNSIASGEEAGINGRPRDIVAVSCGRALAAHRLETRRALMVATSVARVGMLTALMFVSLYPRSVLTQVVPAVGMAPRVGETARDFALTSLDGTPVRLKDRLSHGPVVLVVLRGWPGYHCPFCTRQFGDYLTHAADLKAAGALVVFVYPGPAEGLNAHAQAFAPIKSLPDHFTFLLDPDYAFTNAYGLRWDAPQETAYPSTFVLNARGVVTFAQTSKEHGGRVPVADVLQAVAASAPSARPVVVAELFTSEGCSSCPPADDILRRLAAGELGDIADVIPLGEHVDYWDRLGWRDPFSSASFSSRQSNYDARVFRTDNVYTPQLVVDGRYQALGSNLEAVRRALTAAARYPKAGVVVGAERAGDAGLRVHVAVDLPAALDVHGPADVMVAVTEDHLVTHVRRGENEGRTLQHSAVARSLTAAGHLAAADRAYSATIDIPLSPEWNPANVRIAAFVQERGSRHIVAVGATGPGLPEAKR